LNQDQIELIHREIDGANTPEESAACRSLLADNAEARALDADLRQVTQVFDRMGTAEPPAHLRRAILEALPQQVPAISGWGALRDSWQSIVDGLQKRPRFALVSSLCAGVVAGFALYAVLAGTMVMDRSNTSGLTGTIAEPRAADRWEMLRAVPIEANGVSGRVSVKAGRTAVVVELQSRAAHRLEVRLTFPEGAYGLRGFSQLRSEAEPSFSAGPGLIRVTTSGANTQTFVLDYGGPVSPLALSLFDNGEDVFTATLLPR